ncbi:FAD-dependent oxidoreductase [Dactylosporangium sp. NPDC051541]|uniref:FAD-dependent oxidoreductase n=1 Tax=Dactylosporangium sp. NPDC051541 TaxID=3363977 RepID=UPI0037B4E8A0
MLSRPFSRRHLLGIGAVALGGAALAGCLPSPAPPEADVVVYGATVAGVMAAIQAVRMGRTALILEPGNHIGGMTTGGLGYTDIGAPDSVGGIAAEFYRRIAVRYGATDGSPRYTFEPSVATAVLREMLAEARLTVRTGVRLRTVTRAGGRITSLVAEAGPAYRGRMFIDATYEGDLMAAAGVRWTAGREANSEHGETANGVQLLREVPAKMLVDPYIEPGNAASGLLPGVSATPVAANGSGDELIQAYTFRMCLTQAADRIPLAKPEGYDPATYELLRRYIKNGVSGPFFSTYPVGGGKTDANNLGPYSTDFVGQSNTYPTASWAQRESIVAAHRTYQQGLVWFLANDPRLPAAVRKTAASWGLAADEFTATGGWPPQLYVREARRMRSEYVMTEHDCRGTRTAADPVALASYTMDSHNIQRVVVDGAVYTEGDVLVRTPGPYPVSFRSIVPREAECANLLVPVCLAASHIAYGSIRMEPVFMILGQSAATAAVLAIEAGTAVQRVGYPALRARLTRDGQVLTWPPLPDGDIVVDNAAYTGVTATGDWTDASGTAGYFGADFAHDSGAGGGPDTSFRFTPNLPKAGRWTVYLRWTAAENRARAVPVDIVHSDGTTTRTVDQRASGGTWVPLGTYSFAAGTTGSVLIRTDHTEGYVIADAVRFAPA